VAGAHAALSPELLKTIRVPVIVGPTGIGKSAIAYELALKLDGEIVVADSRQVYERLDIATNKPSPEQRRRVRYHMIDFVDPATTFNAAEYVEGARAAIADIAARVLTSSGHEGKTYPLTGPEALTMTEVAAKLSAATGKPIRYVNVPPEDARQAQLAAGMPAYLADALFELFAERRDGKEGKVWPDAATLLGRPPTSFDEFAGRNAAVFRGEVPPPKV